MDVDQERLLTELGFVLLNKVISEDQVEAINIRLDELWIDEGDSAGAENYVERGVRRLANLADKGMIFRRIFADPRVLAAVRSVVGTNVRLSMLNAREIPPFEEARMPFHCDTDRGGLPDDRGYYSCTAVWMLGPFTRANGATRIIPGSHRSGKLPQEVLEDLYAEHPNEVVLEGGVGDVLVFNGHCWHTGGSNRTDKPRRVLLAHYLRSDIPLADNRQQFISESHRDMFTQQEKELLGIHE